MESPTDTYYKLAAIAITRGAVADDERDVEWMIRGAPPTAWNAERFLRNLAAFAAGAVTELAATRGVTPDALLDERARHVDEAAGL